MMSKREFVREVQASSGLTKEDSLKVTEIVFAQIKEALLQGREVRIGDVGKFRFKFRDPGTVQNNLTGKKQKVGHRVKMKFIVFPSMQKLLKSALLEDES